MDQRPVSRGDVPRRFPRRFQVVPLEERIAPRVAGTGGYDGQPGNQSNAPHNPSGSANPENGNH